MKNSFNSFGVVFVLSIALAACGGGVSESSSGTGGTGVAGAAISLAQTGQKLCFDQAGNTLSSCAGTGQDGEKLTGVVWPSPRFTNNGDGTITDNLTGLIWLQDANCINTKYITFDNDGTAGDGMVTWQHALDFISGINAGTYADCSGGHNDWRLPNTNELISLINYGQGDSGLWLNTQGFSHVQTEFYWSSTSVATTTSSAWIVFIGGGDIYAYLKVNSHYVWPVRSGQKALANLPKTGQAMNYAIGDDGDLQSGIAWPYPRFTSYTDTILDKLTGLIWASDAGTPTVSTLPPIGGKSLTCTGGTMNWQSALNYIACLNTIFYLGHNDWRLPNIKEFGSLINYGQSDSATWLTTQAFSNVQAYYWLSTTRHSLPTGAFLGSLKGDIGTAGKAATYSVWPVRGGQ